MKRIATIQDISCIGKCSLTVALPIISAMGVEGAVIPTAVLSTHTAFKGFTFRDLTSDIGPIADHWKQEGMKFDAIYTGYLGSFEQLTIVSEFFDTFKTEDNLIIVDPVMGDFGRLYPGFSQEFANKMTDLCKKADIIVPNMTEASFMLGVEYRENYDQKYAEEILKKLCEKGAKKAVLTGINYECRKIGIMCYDKEKDSFYTYFKEKVNASYHGTGDVFASTLTGALVRGFSLEESLQIAVDYTVECISATNKDPDSRWYGVNFEETIPYLIKRISK